MKQLIVCIICLAMTIATFSQNVEPLSRIGGEDLLKKSKSQKTLAWLFLGTGTALMITGSLIWNEAYQDNLNSDDPWQVAFAGFTTEGTGITSAGLVVCAGSIPFFILSSNNKRKAIQLGVQTQKVPRLNESQLSKKGIPVLTLKLNL